MKPSFIQGAWVGFVLALGGSALFATLRLFFPTASSLHLLMPVLAGAYVLYLLWRTPAATGRFATFVIWISSAVGVGVLVDSLPLALVIHALMLWLVRTLYFSTSALSAMADLGLGVIAVAASIFAAQHTGSPFLALWTFFLVQALFVAIPDSWGPTPAHPGLDESVPFHRAHQAAESALRRLAVRRAVRR